MNGASDDERLGDWLDHMREASADAVAFVSGMDADDFLRDKRTQRAVTMSLVIVGEAATRIMDAFPDVVRRHPEIPWRAMRGMRNRIAHGYFELDLSVVWETISTALPDLVEQLDAAAGGTRPDATLAAEG